MCGNLPLALFGGTLGSRGPEEAVALLSLVVDPMSENSGTGIREVYQSGRVPDCVPGTAMVGIGGALFGASGRL